MPTDLYSENLNKCIFNEPGKFLQGDSYNRENKSITENSIIQYEAITFFLRNLYRVFFFSLTSFSFKKQDYLPPARQLYKVRCLEKYTH